MRPTVLLRSDRGALLSAMDFKRSASSVLGLASSRAMRSLSSSASHHTSWNGGGGYQLSEDQLALQSALASFAEDVFAPNAAKWDSEKIFPEKELRQAAELGLGGMFVSEESGGTGLSRFEGSVVFETLAAKCPSTTAYISIHNMVAKMIDSFGNQEQKSRLLPKLLTMEHFASYCLTEPSSGSDAASLKTTAVKTEGGYVLNGSKAFISGGSRSDLYLIMARTGPSLGPKGISCFAVEAENDASLRATRAGLSFGAQEKKLGWNSQPTCMVHLDNVFVPDSNLIGEAGQGFTIAMKGLDGGRLSIAACSLGAAREAYDRTREHVQVRQQFNKPLIANQTIQFKLADMATKIHTSRLVIRHAASLLDQDDPNATVYCAMAKKVATDLCYEVIDEALQLHGGYGYLNDYPIERLLRDARVHRILEGTNEVQQIIMARASAADE